MGNWTEAWEVNQGSSNSQIPEEEKASGTLRTLWGALQSGQRHPESAGPPWEEDNLRSPLLTLFLWLNHPKRQRNSQLGLWSFTFPPARGQQVERCPSRKFLRWGPSCFPLFRKPKGPQKSPPAGFWLCPALASLLHATAGFALLSYRLETEVGRLPGWSIFHRAYWKFQENSKIFLFLSPKIFLLCLYEYYFIKGAYIIWLSGNAAGCDCSLMCYNCRVYNMNLIRKRLPFYSICRWRT